jgi:hypothetical protein
VGPAKERKKEEKKKRLQSRRQFYPPSMACVQAPRDVILNATAPRKWLFCFLASHCFFSPSPISFLPSYAFLFFLAPSPSARGVFVGRFTPCYCWMDGRVLVCVRTHVRMYMDLIGGPRRSHHVRSASRRCHPWFVLHGARGVWVGV